MSTRGGAPVLDFADALLAGLAVDGGLYVPESWPQFGAGGRGDYVETAVEVMAPFVGDAIDPDDFAAMVADAYATFDAADVAPIVDLGGGLHLMELFHGPTLAFKDVALQLVGRLFGHPIDLAHVIGVSLGGLLLAVLYLRLGLWAAVSCHWLWNTLCSTWVDVLSLPKKGGVQLFEGAWTTSAVLAATSALLVWDLYRRGRPELAEDPASLI